MAQVAAAGPAGIAVARLTGARDRAATIRRLRALAGAGAIDLAWELRPPSVHRRYVRFVRLTDEGRAARGLDRPAGGRPLGHRQRAAIAMLADDARPAVPAPEISARFGGSAVTSLATRGLVELEATVAERQPYAERDRRSPAMPAGAALNADQALATSEIVSAVETRSASTFLLDGVTASGKTAVYVAAMAAARRLGRGALVLVPEVALATPLLDRLRTETSEDVAILHAGLGDGERADEWRRIRENGVGVVVGTRIALLAPIADLGVIVVDEEHDAAYKSDRTPRFQARDMAVELGRLASAPVVLSQRHAGRGHRGRRADGRDRAHHAARAGCRPGARGRRRRPPPELADGNRVAALGGAGRRARRTSTRTPAIGPSWSSIGAARASVVLCRDCGYVQVCPECQRPLVFHATGMALRCHHCGATAPACHAAARPAAQPASATSAAAPSASSARSVTASRACASDASTATSSSARALPTASWTRSPTAPWTCSSAPAS